ncbi:MAG: mechanosensitive ion channel [Muribaculaceae bacterium]|nr:mechanosensitive ion channel [Muribaculaceae bacterium]
MDVANDEKLVNGSLETNLGLFRAYMKMYLDQSKYIDHDSLCMVGTDQQTAGGIPLLIFCFTNTTVWADYISIQSQIFEHLAVMLASFDLVTFENPSGRDLIGEGYVIGHIGDDLFGSPHPMQTGEVKGGGEPKVN